MAGWLVILPRQNIFKNEKRPSTTKGFQDVIKKMKKHPINHMSNTGKRIVEDLKWQLKRTTLNSQSKSYHATGSWPGVVVGR
jgi:hypothetical protein